jgi:hypothetical protein
LGAFDSARWLDVGFSQPEERGFNEAKAEISGKKHQDKEDKRPKTCQIEIGNVHYLLMYEPGHTKHHKEMQQVDGVRVFSNTPYEF